MSDTGMRVHNHGPEEGGGYACREWVIDGRFIIGDCLLPDALRLPTPERANADADWLEGNALGFWAEGHPVSCQCRKRLLAIAKTLRAREAAGRVPEVENATTLDMGEAVRLVDALADAQFDYGIHSHPAREAAEARAALLSYIERLHVAARSAAPSPETDEHVETDWRLLREDIRILAEASELRGARDFRDIAAARIDRLYDRYERDAVLIAMLQGHVATLSEQPRSAAPSVPDDRNPEPSPSVPILAQALWLLRADGRASVAARLQEWVGEREGADENARIERLTFDELLATANPASSGPSSKNPEKTVPWSWYLRGGIPVTHENDDCYIVDGVHVHRGESVRIARHRVWIEKLSRAAPSVTPEGDACIRPGKTTATCGHELAPYWADDPRSQTITKSRTRDGRKSLCYAVDCEACRWSWEKAGILFKTQGEAEAWMSEPWRDDGEIVR